MAFLFLFNVLPNNSFWPKPMFLTSHKRCKKVQSPQNRVFLYQKVFAGIICFVCCCIIPDGIVGYHHFVFVLLVVFIIGYFGYPILSYPTLSYRILPYPILPYPTLSYPILYYPILSYPILSYPTLSYPTLSYPILPYPIL